jgi:hypothetical protein
MARDSPDEEFRKEWKKFVKDFLPNKFDRYSYEDVRDGPEGYAKEVVNAIEKGDPFIFIDAITERSSDYFLEGRYSAYQNALKEFSKQWENPEVVKKEMQDYDYFQDDFDEIYDEREVNNWWILIEGLNLLVWNTENQFNLGWVESERDAKTEMELDPHLAEFYRLSGLTEKRFEDLVANGYDYDVQGFIGEIIDASVLIQHMAGLSASMTWKNRGGEKIVAFHNGLNGSGYFLPAPKAEVGLDASKKMEVDFGSYSLGDVFGTRDWTWR